MVMDGFYNSHPSYAPLIARMHMYVDFNECPDGVDPKTKRKIVKCSRPFPETEILANRRIPPPVGEVGKYISPIIAFVYGLRCTSDALESLCHTVNVMTKVFTLVCPSFVKCQSYKLEMISIPAVLGMLQLYKLLNSKTISMKGMQEYMFQVMKKGNGAFIIFNMVCLCFYILQKLKMRLN